VLAQPDVRRKKKSAAVNAAQKVPWEKPPNKTDANIDQTPENEGEPLRLNLETEKWGLNPRW
jgi:hypothetical protein